VALEQLTLFPPDTHASLFPTPGSDGARKMTATSGRRLSESYRKSGPVGLLAKMLLDTSLWGSTTSYLTWKTRATPRNRLLFQLQLSMPATDETGCSLWPAPHANCHTGAGEKGGGGMDIQTAVKMWPTPRANDAEKRGNVSDDPRNGLPGAVKLWTTPQAHDAKPGSADRVGRFGSKHGGRNLNDYVMLWPTPTANDAKNATLPPSAKDWDSVPGAIMREGHTAQEGQLNPEWVEALMNFPVGWTDVD